MDRSYPIQAKLERANKHLAELRTAVKEFLDSAFVFETKMDYDKQEYSYYVLSVEDCPSDQTAIIGDVLHSLRSALDYLAWQLVDSAGSRPTQNTSFPIFDDPSKYAAQSPGKLKGMRPDAVAAIDALKPYKEGNNLLWQLHKLNIIDKHRMLITAASAMDMHSLTPSMRTKLLTIYAGSYPNEPLPDLRGVMTPAHTLKFPLKAGDLLLILPVDRITSVVSTTLVLRSTVSAPDL
jgi:hypothetical protein